MTNQEKITTDSNVEEFVEKHPKAVGWLVQHGIICVVCGEPFWGTLGDLMEKKNIKNPEKLLKNLNKFITGLDS
ncbi:DUF1858 domain-containing protein [bacterium]|nr:DUF1858 domain-containing protein [bacterium]